MSKYGDGFKSGPGRKSEAYVAPAAGPEPEAFAAAADPAALPANLAPIGPALSDLQARLAVACSAAAEQKMLAEANKAAAVLMGKLATGMVGADVGAKALQMVMACGARDFATANSIQKDLAATAWNDHKDWVKGIKRLLELAQRKGI